MDRIKYDSYKINIEYIDEKHDRSMREVYGLDPRLAEQLTWWIRHSGLMALAKPEWRLRRTRAFDHSTKSHEMFNGKENRDE